MLGRLFYFFTGLHSFLIGLFPFYIPVYLHTIGLTLSGICLFIATTGIGYCCALFLWDRVCRKVSFPLLVTWSFCSELLLLSFFLFEQGLVLILAAGIVNGIFNCNFWIVQRLLFVKSTAPENSGRNFGNFQIFVLLVLKAGILLGGILLEKWGFLSIFLLSGAVALGAMFFSTRLFDAQIDDVIKLSKPIDLSRILNFKDRLGSQSFFVIDGVFLYLESYFWLLTLFYIVHESFLKLGLVVIVLAAFFGLVFTFIKSRIDSLPGQKVYVAAVVLYSISWILRGVLDENLTPLILLWLLALITLCTSVFRLTLNKRFFDNAGSTDAYEYIFIKSYISQFFLVVVFVAMAGVFSLPGPSVSRLSMVYYCAAMASTVYLLYRRGIPRIEGTSNRVSVHS